MVSNSFKVGMAVAKLIYFEFLFIKAIIINFLFMVFKDITEFCLNNIILLWLLLLYLLLLHSHLLPTLWRILLSLIFHRLLNMLLLLLILLRNSFQKNYSTPFCFHIIYLSSQYKLMGFNIQAKFNYKFSK